MKRQGEFVNNLSGEMSYKSFNPSDLPPVPSIKIDEDMLHLISKANRILGKLDQKSDDIPNKELYISMYIRKEALLSSQIEGTQATLDDIFDPNIDANINLEVTDVINYIKASTYSNELIQTLPLSSRFLKNIHEVLLEEVRGEDKNPGEFRKTQNWIGPQGSSLKNAKFIPPNVSDMNDAMSKLENYIHYDESNHLIKIALAHYQFETIHPFLDGNGRIGRLLIGLMLKEYKLLNTDILYISYYFKRNRIEYYDRLMDVRLKGHYEQWIKFFLKGIIEAGNNSLECINLLISLNKKNAKLIETKIPSSKKSVFEVFRYIQSNPIIDIPETSKKIGKAYNTTANAIKKLQDLGILIIKNEQDRNRIYIYEDYLAILREGTELNS
ncbi:MAG: Fic family protein [Candidatus Izimaplasma sp.]|nr:Fic family protein [Candidatus Izimaplasma bacterium]